MGNNGGRANLKNTPNISDTRAIHGHLYDAFVHARNVTIIAIFKLKAFIAVSASVSLMTCFSLAIFNDIRRFFAVNTRHLNNRPYTAPKIGSIPNQQF